MASILSLFFVGLAASSAIPQTSKPSNLVYKRDDGDCSAGPWVDPVYAGGYEDGTTVNFCETGYPSYGHPIGQINVYSTVQAVRGINFNYDDPNQALSIPAGTQTYGTSSGEGITGQTLNINYAGGELISSVTMYAPDGAKYVRGLTITTNMGQTLQSGVDASSGFNAITQDVGTGILIGAAGGYQPGIIDDLGFFFLDSPVASIVVTDITVTGGPTGAQDIAPMTLAAQHFFNGDTTPESWSFSGSKTVTSTSVITQTIVDTFGGMEAVAVSFSGGFLDIIKSGATSTTTFSWSTMQTSTTTTMFADANELSWMQGGTLQPNEGITCDSVSGQGSGTFPFTSTVTITLQDGTVYAQYKDYGSFAVNAVSANSVTCNPTTGS